jgi:hypothetical protein
MGFYTGVCVGICSIIILIIILANKLPPIDCTNPVTVAQTAPPAAPVSNQPQPYSEGIAPAPTAGGPAPEPDPLGRWATPGWAQPSDGTLRAPMGPTSSGYEHEF